MIIMPALSDRVVSLLRTVVPVIWGSLIAWFLTIIALPASVSGFLTNQTDIVVVVAIAGWYAAFRWLEPKLPAWLTRIVLGSNLTPIYVTPSDQLLHPGFGSALIPTPVPVSTLTPTSTPVPLDVDDALAVALHEWLDGPLPYFYRSVQAEAHAWLAARHL